MLFPVLWIIAWRSIRANLSRPDGLNLIPPGASFDAFVRVIDQPTSDRSASSSWRSTASWSPSSVRCSRSARRPAAYAFSRLQFRGRGALMIAVLAVLMLPSVATIVPLFILLNQFQIDLAMVGVQLADSLVGVTLAIVAGLLPFAIWNLKGYLDTIPKDLEEAAAVDGATQNQSSARSCCRWPTRRSPSPASSASSPAGPSTTDGRPVHRRSPRLDAVAGAQQHGRAVRPGRRTGRSLRRSQCCSRSPFRSCSSSSSATSSGASRSAASRGDGRRSVAEPWTIGRLVCRRPLEPRPIRDQYVQDDEVDRGQGDRHRARGDPQQVEEPEHGDVVDDQQPEPASTYEQPRADRCDVEGDREREQSLGADGQAPMTPMALISWMTPVTMSSAAASSIAAGRGPRSGAGRSPGGAVTRDLGVSRAKVDHDGLARAEGRRPARSPRSRRSA